MVYIVSKMYQIYIKFSGASVEKSTYTLHFSHRLIFLKTFTLNNLMLAIFIFF